MNVNDVLTFSYTGAVQEQTLENGTYKFECWGAQGGGNYGGLGGYCVGEYEVLTEISINIYVGQQPTTQTGGWNGGGNALGGNGQTAGGGASDIRIGTTLNDRVIVGAGGGGRGSRDTRANGHGGGLVGVNAESDGTSPGTGGTQTNGGSDNGVFGLGGGSGGNSGGGGGGWYGGGSGGNYGGGGGGSSYYGTLENASTTSGVKSGNGEIKITMLSGGGVTPVVKKRRFAQII